MIYRSQRQTKAALVLTVLLLAVAAVCGVISGLGFGWKSLWQILMMGALVAVIQITQRYLLSDYEYILDPIEDVLTHNRLTVIRIVGERRTSVFTVPLSSLTEVIPYRKGESLKETYGTPAQRMDFCPDLFPSGSYLLLFESNGDLTAVRLQCDAAFAEELKKRKMV
jgi:hypothetical protein